MKQLFYILAMLFIHTSCERDDEIQIQEQYIEYEDLGVYSYTNQIELQPDENSIEAHDLSGLDIIIAIEDSEPYSGKTYQLNGVDELARVYFEKNDIQTFLYEGTLTINQISDNEIQGTFSSSKSVNIYYTQDMFQNDSIGQAYTHSISNGKFYFKGTINSNQ